MKTISLTVPLDQAVLIETAEYLRSLSCSLGAMAPAPQSPSGRSETNAPAPQNIPIRTEDGQRVRQAFTPPPPSTETPEAETPPPSARTLQQVADDQEVARRAAKTPAPPPPSTETPEAETATPASVVLDSAGLPWDARIHAGTKTRIARTDRWKPKRSVDTALVAQVEAELKATMAAPAPDQAPAPQAQAGAETSGASTNPAAPKVDPKTITNFAEFMSACTYAGVAPDRIVTACQAHGVAAPTLLAARPDLVTDVARSLFAPGA